MLGTRVVEVEGFEALSLLADSRRDFEHLLHQASAKTSGTRGNAESAWRIAVTAAQCNDEVINRLRCPKSAESSQNLE